MSDVREELVKFFNGFGWGSVSPTYADSLMKEFDVTPKPVVTDEELGEMLTQAVMEGNSPKTYGAKMLEKMSDAGLKIVRVSDES